MNTLIPLSSTLVAAIIAWIAVRSYTLSLERLKLDLFDRRYTVYESAKKLLTYISKNDLSDLEHLFEFRRETNDCDFLFNTEVREYLDDLDRKALELRTTQRVLEPLPVGDKRTNLASKEEALKNEFMNEWSKLRKTFEPYLKFRHIR